MSLNSKLFGPFSAEAFQRERDRHAGSMPHRRASHSYCETCASMKPRGAAVVRKGWKCSDCKPKAVRS